MFWYEVPLNPLSAAEVGYGLVCLVFLQELVQLLEDAFGANEVCTMVAP